MVKILVVDDEVKDLELMKTSLEKAGHNVATAEDGADAMDLFENERDYNLILVDIKMPTVSGYDLMRLMKEQEKIESRVVYVSIVPEKEADLDGAEGFIQKPFSSEKFVEQVNRFIK